MSQLTLSELLRETIKGSGEKDLKCERDLTQGGFSDAGFEDREVLILART